MSKKRLKYVAVLGIIAGTVIQIYVLTRAKQNQSTVVAKNTTVYTEKKSDCRSTQSTDYQCWKTYYQSLVVNESVKSAFDHIKSDYKDMATVTSNCHQLTHNIGRAAMYRYGNVVDAYKNGDDFCWSGYQHGAIEQVFLDLGDKKVEETITSLCEPLKAEAKYGLYHFTCVHGVGHGIMAFNDNELFKSLAKCDEYTDSWEKDSCYGGVFMENIISKQNPDHKTSYIKDDDPLYPCTAVAQKYKVSCYMNQTSHALTVYNRDFAKVFKLCSTIEADLVPICYQSLGRDASGNNNSDIYLTKATCATAASVSAETNCVMGAVKDIVYHYHDDIIAKQYCALYDNQAMNSDCLAAADSFYSIF
jgi:hypothetical protein